MDEETRAYLDRMMAKFNDTAERLINQVTSLRADFQNTKGFLIEDAIILGRRASDADQRIDRLEEEVRKSRGAG